MARRLMSVQYHGLASIRGFEWLGPEVRNGSTKTKWSCGKGHEWEAVYSSIRKGRGCPHCSLLETQSKGEKRVSKFLAALDIMFVRQKIFDGCKDKGHLRYDFYFSFSGHQFLIEYNGEQHYEPVECWGGAKGLEDAQRRDRIKTNFAQANGLHLITIPHAGHDRIGTIIIDSLTEATGESPLTFEDRIGEARRVGEVLDGVQLSLELEEML